MKTVSTKLDNGLHDRFLELCNEEGKCQSEMLRDMVEQWCEASDDGKEMQTSEISELRNPRIEIVDIE